MNRHKTWEEDLVQSQFPKGELDNISVAEDFSVVQTEGSRDVKRPIKHYNLDAIIAVGYRVNSKRATAFRQWALAVDKTI